MQISGEGASMEVVLWGDAAEGEVSCGRSIITALIKDGSKLTSTASSQVEVCL